MIVHSRCSFPQVDSEPNAEPLGPEGNELIDRHQENPVCIRNDGLAIKMTYV